MKISAKAKKQVDKKTDLTGDLETCCVRLRPTTGATTTIGSATMLYKVPTQESEPETNTTILASSKGAILEYWKQAGVATNPPAFKPNDASFKKLVKKFTDEVSIEYQQTLWTAPGARVRLAPIKEIHFMLDDSSWDYDLCLLVSMDKDLAEVASTKGIWEGASSWKNVDDLPGDIHSYYAKALNQTAWLAGFGTVVVPNVITAQPTAVQANKAFTISPPTTGAAIGPVPGIPADSFQICLARIPTATPLDMPISTWPSPPPAAGAFPPLPTYSPLSVDKDYKPVRKYDGAAHFQANDQTVAVRNDTGGGVFVRINNQYGTEETRFLGVISDVNGTIEGQGGFNEAFKNLDSANLGQVVTDLQPYLPWPTNNQIITLMSGMLNNWPLDWPALPSHFTSCQQAMANEFITKYAKASQDSDIRHILSKVFVHDQAKATPSNYDSVSIRHASSGDRNTKYSATILYQRTIVDEQVTSIQIFAVGSHDTDTTYKIYWVWDTYSEWYDNKYTEWQQELVGKQKSQRQTINEKYEKILGKEKIVKGQTYTVTD